MPRLTTDETLRSQLKYGDPDFPFACFLDCFEQYESPCVEWHWHNEFEFSFVAEGSVICHVGTNHIKLHAGDGLFINSGTIHRFETTGHGVLANFIFSPEFIVEKSSVIYSKYIQPFLFSDCEYRVYSQHLASDKAILKRLKEIYAAVYSDCFGRELQIRNLISELWYSFAENTLAHLCEAPKCRDRMAQARLQKMMMYIHANYYRRVTLEDIASAANISRSEALRCFHVVIETTPVKYLNEYRLNRAVERLLSTSESITAIADAAGFDSTGYFCRVFKTEYGVSPNAFRRKNKPSVSKHT